MASSLEASAYDELLDGAVARLVEVGASLLAERFGSSDRTHSIGHLFDDAQVSATPDIWMELFEELPVFAHVTGLVLCQWRSTVIEMLTRVTADLMSIEASFFGGEEAGPLVHIATGAGDRHVGGRSVALLRFQRGLGLVYKPRNLDLEVLVNDVVDIVNQSGFTPPIPTLSFLLRQGYGYAERVDPRPIEDTGDAAHFYRRLGAMASILQLLGTRDMIADNLLADAAEPHFVDVECALSPTLEAPPLMTAVHERLYRRREGTVLSTAMLLAAVRPSEICPTRDLGCLSHADEVRYADGSPLPIGPFRPFGLESPVDPWLYSDEVEQGYRDVHAVLVEDRWKVLKLVEEAARKGRLSPRFIWRSTFDYRVAIAESLRPEGLRSPGSRHELLRRYIFGSIAEPEGRQFRIDVSSVSDAEVTAMLALDVPRFWTDAEEVVIHCPDGRVLEDQFEESGIDALRRRIANPSDLESDVLYLRAAIDAARGGASEPVVAARTSSVCTPDPLHAANEIGEQLLAARHPPVGSCDGWISVRVDPIDGIADVVPARADLVGGALGPALFLAELGRAAGEPRYGAIAVETIRELIEAVQLDPRLGYWGILWGQPANAGLVGVAALLDVGEAVADLSGTPSLAQDLEPLRSLVLTAAMELVEQHDASGLAPLHRSLQRWSCEESQVVACGAVIASGIPVLSAAISQVSGVDRRSPGSAIVPSGLAAITLALVTTLCSAPFLVQDPSAQLTSLEGAIPSGGDRGARLAALAVRLLGFDDRPVEAPQPWEPNLPVGRLLTAGEEWQCRRWAVADAESEVEAQRFVDDLLRRRAETGRFLKGRIADDPMCLSAVDGIVAAGRLCLRSLDPSLPAAGFPW